MLRVSRRLGTRRPVDGRAVGDPAPADMTSEGDVNVPAAEADPGVPVSDPDTARTKDADSTSGVGVHKNDAETPTFPGDDEPDELLCPITKVMMRDPVFVAGSGNTYEREAIETYWRQTASRPVRGARGVSVGVKRDPLTNLDLNNDAIFTNWDKRREVQAWLAKNLDTTPEGWPNRDVPPPLEERRKAQGGRDGDGNGERSDAVSRVELIAQMAKLAALGGVGLAVVAALFVATTSPAPSSDGLLSRWEFARDGASSVDGASHDASSFARELRLGSYAWRKHYQSTNVQGSNALNQHSQSGEVAAIERFGEDAYRSLTPVRAPSGSRIAARKGPGGALEVVVPPKGVLSPAAMTELGFAAVWTSFTAVWTWGAMRTPHPFFALFSLPFWGIGATIGRSTAASAMETTRLVIAPTRLDPHTGDVMTRGRFHVSWEALGRVLSVAEGPLEDVAGVDVVTHAYVNGVPQTALELTAGVRSHNLGRGLHSSEQRFVAELVRECLVEAANGEDGGKENDGGGGRAYERRPELIKSRL